jgi:hypothetical protein
MYQYTYVGKNAVICKLNVIWKTILSQNQNNKFFLPYGFLFLYGVHVSCFGL